MSALTVTPAKVGPAFSSCRIRSVLGSAAINGGTAVYINASGQAAAADSASATTAQFAGIAIPRMNNGYACGQNQACEIVEEGEVEGFDLSGMAYWAPVYLQDGGGLGTAAGTHSAIVGKVVPTSELDASGNPKKLLYVHAPFNTVVS